MTVASLLLRRPAEARVTQTALRSAIIDIGSNSVRLVVYEGPARIPAILFNEKVMVGLGRALTDTGAIDPKAIAVAIQTLARFKRLSDAMGVDSVRTVATAAVRDATNGRDLLDRVRALGLKVDLLSGEQEAEAAGWGVLSGIPDADGIVGDLGGGSLELVRIKDGEVQDRVSFPLGVLRIAGIKGRGKGALDRQVGKHLEKAGWLEKAHSLPFYLVGGSWRALARLHMALTEYPLPVMHQYRMNASAAAHMVRVLARIDRRRLKAIPSLSSSRIATLGEAAGLLAVLVRRLQSSDLVVSAFGLREGLLYQALGTEDRALDPLIAACHEEAARQGRFVEHGDLLDGWISPLFADESAEDARLRHAACLLGDVGWRANPEFRAERGLDTAVHGNWVNIDARGRAMLGQALFTSFGGGSVPLPELAPLCDQASLEHAIRWGLAMRLGQRLSGGVAGPLRASYLSIEGSALRLNLDPQDAALYGDPVQRRHRQLAVAFGLEAALGG